MTLWVTVLLASAIAFGLKLAGHVVPHSWLDGARVARIAAMLPVALLAALVAVQTFTTTGGTQLIPDVKTDFIYSALAQELGLIGVSALLLVFMVFVARGMKVALRVDDGFSKLLAAGLTFGFALQTFTIVGGIIRIIPLTGITLPFVSYGGSSIVANFVLLAGLMLLSNRANAQRGNAA